MKRAMALWVCVVAMLASACGGPPMQCVNITAPVTTSSFTAFWIEETTHENIQLASPGGTWACTARNDAINCDIQSSTGSARIFVQFPIGTVFHDGDEFKPTLSVPWDIEVTRSGKRIHILDTADEAGSARIQVVRLPSGATSGELKIVGQICDARANPAAVWFADIHGSIQP